MCHTRAEAEYRMREDPYREQRAAAETDMYVSYPTNARMPNEPAGYVLVYFMNICYISWLIQL